MSVSAIFHLAINRFPSQSVLPAYHTRFLVAHDEQPGFFHRLPGALIQEDRNTATDSHRGWTLKSGVRIRIIRSRSTPRAG